MFVEQRDSDYACPRPGFHALAPEPGTDYPTTKLYHDAIEHAASRLGPTTGTGGL